jgi:hypothetical protein
MTLYIYTHAHGSLSSWQALENERTHDDTDATDELVQYSAVAGAAGAAAGAASVLGLR